MAARDIAGNPGLLLSQENKDWRNRYPAKSALTKSAQRSPIMIDGALVLPLISLGMIEASAT
jgi:hypothetical protein